MPEDITKSVELSVFPMGILFSRTDTLSPPVVADRIIDASDLFPLRRSRRVETVIMRMGQTEYGPVVEMLERRSGHQEAVTISEAGVEIAVSTNAFCTQYRLNNEGLEGVGVAHRNNKGVDGLAANKLFAGRVTRFGGDPRVVAQTIFDFLPQGESPIA